MNLYTLGPVPHTGHAVETDLAKIIKQTRLAARMAKISLGSNYCDKIS